MLFSSVVFSRITETFILQFSYLFSGSVGKLSEGRPCCGTTVTITDLFGKCPVRRKRVSDSHTMNEVFHMVRCFAVSLAGKISISLRDEQKGKVLMNTTRSKNTKGERSLLVIAFYQLLYDNI